MLEQVVHIHDGMFFFHLNDPIVFLRLSRFFLYTLIGILILMRSKNLLDKNIKIWGSLFFFASALFAYDIAVVRMVAIDSAANFLTIVPPARLLFSEIVVTIMSLVIFSLLLYNRVKKKELEKINGD